MNNEIPQLYEAVSVETKDALMAYTYDTVKEDWNVLGKLRPLPNHVAISVERLSALEKCVKELQNMVNCWDADTFQDLDIDYAKQALSNLSPNKTTL